MGATMKPKPRAVSILQGPFLASIAILGRISEAATAAKISRQSHYRWLKEDPAYPALFATARAKAIDAWQDEAIRRAVDGVFEPLTYKGEFVYPVIGFHEDPKTKQQDQNRPIYRETPNGLWKKPDRLLEFLLRANKPEVYGRGNSVKAEVTKPPLAFKGTMEDLLVDYRNLTLGPPDESYGEGRATRGTG